jgi:hypothetical protein
MADTKISGLTPGAPSQATDMVPVRRGAGNVSLLLSDILSKIFGVITSFDGVATEGMGVFVLRKTTQLNGQTAAINPLLTFTPAADASLDVTCSILVTTSSAESFSVQVVYTDAGNTARTAIQPFRLLTGANVLITASANGAIPYAGVLNRFRAKGGTLVTVKCVGTFTGCTYNVGASIFQSS